jgi:nicotinamide mononucleotide transporter
MNEIIDFFTDPYKAASGFDIFLEIIAALFGIASVLFARKESIWVYPTGIISTVIYIYICYVGIIYGDMIVNIYYTLMSIYGWYMWSRLIDNHHIEITRTNRVDKLKATGIFIFTAVFVLFIYSKYKIIDTSLGLFDSIEYVFSNLNSLENFRKITPYIDTFTTASAFVGMWLMANKKLENWTFWIITNIVSVPLYFVKGYGFTGIQYFIFLILAFYGYTAWKKTLDKKTSTL